MLKTIILTPVNFIIKPFPGAKLKIDKIKKNIKLHLKLKYFIPDIIHAKRYMFWTEKETSYAKLSAELVFQYHKLEKGLCIPGEKRFFGRDPVIATCLLLLRWRESGHSLNDPVYLGALETLRSYNRRLVQTPAPENDAKRILSLLDRCLGSTQEAVEYATPLLHRKTDGATDIFEKLCVDRRSVRAYSSKPVPIELLEKTIKLAQLSPSACNRQPWLVHIYRNPAQIKKLLALQSGNAGFGHQLSTLLVITADSRYFFDASERNEPYIDAGLFSMSLILALQSHNLASCCLNWCVQPEVDKKGHALGEIPENEKIIMYLAVGYAAEDALVPRSQRRALNSVMIFHESESSVA